MTQGPPAFSYSSASTPPSSGDAGGAGSADPNPRFTHQQPPGFPPSDSFPYHQQGLSYSPYPPHFFHAQQQQHLFPSTGTAPLMALMSQYYYAQQPRHHYEHRGEGKASLEQSEKEAGEISSTDDEPQARKASSIGRSSNRVSRELVEASNDIDSWREERRRRHPSGRPVEANAASPAASVQMAHRPGQPKAKAAARSRKKTCSYYFSRGVCKNGDRCTFLHQRHAGIPFAKLDSLHQRRVQEMNALLANPARMLAMLDALRRLASAAAV